MSFAFCAVTLIIIAVLSSWIKEDLEQGQLFFDPASVDWDNLAASGFRRPSPLQSKVIVLVVAVAFFTSELKALVAALQ